MYKSIDSTVYKKMINYFIIQSYKTEVTEKPQYFISVILFFKLFFWVGVHCNIYKNSYNMSCLNSSPPTLSSILLSPHSWNSFRRSHFSIYISVYTVFALYSPSYTFSPLPFPSHWYHFPR
jgi:hypothetical protein